MYVLKPTRLPNMLLLLVFGFRLGHPPVFITFWYCRLAKTGDESPVFTLVSRVYYSAAGVSAGASTGASGTATTSGAASNASFTASIASTPDSTLTSS